MYSVYEMLICKHAQLVASCFGTSADLEIALSLDELLPILSKHLTPPRKKIHHIGVPSLTQGMRMLFCSKLSHLFKTFVFILIKIDNKIRQFMGF